MTATFPNSTHLTSSSTKNKLPPKPRLFFRVGVTGHRFLNTAATEAVADVSSEVLRTIWETANSIHVEKKADYDSAPPIVCAVSLLAPGTDSIVAHQTLQLRTIAESKYELHAILPFEASTYEQDFKQSNSLPGLGSVSSFRSQLKGASRVFVLDGDHSSLDSRLCAYETAGRMMLQHCELLLVVLDPTNHTINKQGSTGQIFNEAQKAGIPCVLINPSKPLPPVFYSTVNNSDILPLGEQSSYLKLVSNAVRDILTPIPIARQETNQELTSEFPDLRRFFFAKPTTSHVSRALYRFPWLLIELISRLFRKETYLIVWHSIVGLQQISPQPLQSTQGATEETKSQVDFEDNYRLIHQMAIDYAILYRGSFLWNYILGAVSVSCAVLTYLDSIRELVWTFLELVALTLLATNYLVTRQGLWRDKFVDYRVLAEHFRYMRLLHLLGLNLPGPHHPVYQVKGNLRLSWIDWYFRAVVREVGLPSVCISPHYLKSVVLQIKEKWVKRQITYHHNNLHFLHAASKAIKLIKWMLFLSAFSACIIHLVGHIFHFEFLPNTLLFIAAAVPAWVSALHAIEIQGEFERLHDRSSEMKRYLENLLSVLEKKNIPISFATLHSLTRDLSQTALAEVVDWRIVYRASDMQP